MNLYKKKSTSDKTSNPTLAITSPVDAEDTHFLLLISIATNPIPGQDATPTSSCTCPCNKKSNDTYENLLVLQDNAEDSDLREILYHFVQKKMKRTKF